MKQRLSALPASDKSTSMFKGRDFFLITSKYQPGAKYRLHDFIELAVLS